jgi:phosphoglycerate kinase
MIKYISELNSEQLNGKKVLLRVDFNVAIDPQTKRITEPFRIKSHKETIDYLVANGAKIMLVSHNTSISSFLPIVEGIGDVIGHTLTLIPHEHAESAEILFEASSVLLLENVRMDKREIENSNEFADILTKGLDLYVNDAFSESHRKYASMVAVSEKLPAYGGLLLKKELEELSKTLNAPLNGKIVILGGAKISTKLPVINNFLDKSEKILIGGAIANNFFKQTGYDIGVSLVDETEIRVKDDKIITPKDIVITNDKTGKSGIRNMQLANIKADEMIVDIGPETTGEFMDLIEKAEMVIWNGPLGLSEVDAFAGGTKAIAKAVSLCPKSVIGGGDTIAAVNKMGLLEKYSFVSTGGGAMLTFLAGEEMPGLVALNK